MRTEKKRKRKRTKINYVRFTIFLLLCALIIGGIVFGVSRLISAKKTTDDSGETTAENTQPETEPTPKEPEYVNISIRCVGDIMAHMGQVNAAKQSDGTYDFEPQFEFIEQYLQEADLAMGNLETTFSGDGTYSGYPGFDSPDELASNMAEIGLDVALFANNHMLDTKLAGAQRTVQLLRDSGMTVVGARVSTDENRSAVVEVKGVKIGIVAYTYETPLVNGKRTLNGSAGSGMNSGAADYINTFRYYNIEEDEQTIKAEMDWCRENGAQIVICYFHWGNEYWTTQSDDDLALAQYVAENGADIIFASHPHVLQKISMIGNTPVFWSMGNIVSNQRYESLKDVYGSDTATRTEQGMIACVDIKFCLDDGTFELTDVGAIPTWVDRYGSGKTLTYKVVPLVGDLTENETLKTSGHTSRAQSALEYITGLLGEEYIYK